jgi:homoserine kinase
MDDPVVTPHRMKLIPRAQDVVEAALAAGAAGVSISGSGPTLFALTDGVNAAKVVADAMREMWLNKGISCDIHTSPVGGPGAELYG